MVLAAAKLGAAQTFTDCNPTEKSNCPSDPALGKSIEVDFTSGSSDQFSLAGGTTLKYGQNGAEFVITQETDAPTITSEWYIFFGSVEVELLAAPGTGIVSSFVMESDDLDEIDWEWLGGNTAQVESNYFGKGNTTTYNRAIYHSVDTPQSTWHTYKIDWTKDSITWSVDGNSVRTLNSIDANRGNNFPQTPMRVKVGNWDGGGSKEPEGTVQWAGGHSDFSQGQNYTMYVKNIKITDGTTSGSEYSFGDQTGSYESVKISGASGGAAVSAGSSNSSSTASSTASGSTSASGSASASATASTGGTTLATSTQSAAATATAASQPIGDAPTASTTSTAGSPTANGGGFAQGTATSTSAGAAKTAAAAAIRPNRYGMANCAVAGLAACLGYMIM
ncbi:MAG: hypothetical protein M1818_006630 [Claussenomyces sp. TS43310]|nr:MAG: hypothetical protein M1818_006936 [Claussenomyces sp. TS43310]KAI9735053.1 MAG: hypothetical protein M1818_006630 [Claussenomyces sp. TS43310]